MATKRTWTRETSTRDVGNYLNPVRRFQLIFIATRHDYRSHRSRKAAVLLFRRRFVGELTSSSDHGRQEYFRTTVSSNVVNARNTRAPIIHNIGTLNTRIHRDVVSTGIVNTLSLWLLSAISLLRAQMAFNRERINRYIILSYEVESRSFLYYMCTSYAFNLKEKGIL